jgi:hypoxanthine phosphoribosyltransferase
MDKVDVLISKEEIAERVTEICQDINRDLNGEDVVVVVLLKGAFIFASDIVREINCPVTIDFVRLSSYADGTVSTGNIKVEQGLSADITYKNVLVIEDIADTGKTLSFFIGELKSKNPKSVKVCVLLNKEERRTADVKLDYVGFNIHNEFVVGYGLDYAQKYRNLPFIGSLTENGKVY